jgi:hypothetical protein
MFYHLLAKKGQFNGVSYEICPRTIMKKFVTVAAINLWLSRM